MIDLRGLFARFPLHRYALHAGRWTWYVSAAALFLAAVVLLVLRLWLPTATGRSDAIARFLSQRSGQVVRIDEIRPYWHGLHPGLRLLGIEVYAPHSTQPAVRLHELRASIAWLPLLRGRVEANELTLVQPRLALERRADGHFKLFGLRARAQTSDEDGEDKFVSLLFAQKEIVVQDATLRWIDLKAHTAPLTLSHVNITLRNAGDRHRFGMSAAFPAGMCGGCSFIADIHGNPLRLEPWSGRVYLRAIGVNLSAFPPVVREHLPAALAGVFDVQLWSSWADARPKSILGEIAASEVRVPDTPWSRGVAIRRASTNLDWERHGDGWRLSLREPQIALDGRAWSPGHVRVDFTPKGSRISVAHVDLSDVAWVASRVSGHHPVLAALTAMRPRGTVDAIDAHIDGPWSKATPFTVDADVSGVRTEPYRHVPGIRGVSGHVRLTRDGGEATLQSENGELNFATVFGAPIPIGRASGHVQWERQADRWRVFADRFQARSPDGQVQGDLEVQWPFDRAVSPIVRVHAVGTDLDLTDAARYYPLNVTSERFRAWLSRSVRGGTVTSAELDLDGPVRQFRAGGGRLELHAHVTNGTFSYLKGWEPIHGINADLLFRDSEMVATGDGTMRSLGVGSVVVHVPDMRAPGGPVVSVSGEIAGPLQDTLTVLRTRPVEPGQIRVPAALAATGNGVLGLDLVIPVHHAHDFTLRGEYQFDNNLIALGALRLRSVQGLLGFTRTGLRNGQVRARLLGGDSVMTVTPSEHDPDRAHSIDAHGTLTQAGLADLGNFTAVRLDGGAPWSAQVVFDHQVPRLALHVDLAGLEADLPPPFDKARGVPLPLVLTTERASTDEQVLAAALGDRARARFAFVHGDEGWRFLRGHVAVGDARLPPSSNGGAGLWASLNVRELNVDRWLRLLGGRGGGGAFTLPAFLTRVSAKATTVDAFDRHFGPLALDLQRNGKVWGGGVEGREIAGAVQFAPPDRSHPSPSIVLRLARLQVPPRTAPAPAARAAAPAPSAHWPALSVSSAEFELGPWHLGRLDFAGTPLSNGFHVDHLVLVRPDMTLNATGQWQEGSPQPRSVFQGSLNSNDIGQTLTALNLPNQVAGGKAEVRAQLSWPGGPSAFDLAHLSGEVSVKATKGNFVKVRQGAGRLLGLFDVRSLARYLTFDFSSLFGRGFAFDEVRGDFAVDDGDARTDNLAVVGPSASLHIRGRTGLARKDFDLQIGVEPHLRDNITVAGAILGGPVGAGAAWVVQRLLRKPIARTTRIVYMVKGPWDNPTVQRVGH